MMSFLNILRPIGLLSHAGDFQHHVLRYGHQMCTKWQDRAPKAKRRGIKRYHNEKVTNGTVLVHQSYRTFFPGMNVMMNPEKTTLVALTDGTVKVTCEAFDPNFDHPLVVEHYSQRKGTMYKKYFHVIPDPQHNRFKLVDVV